jgi:hypothetical protein
VLRWDDILAVKGLLVERQQEGVRRVRPAARESLSGTGNILVLPSQSTRQDARAKYGTRWLLRPAVQEWVLWWQQALDSFLVRCDGTLG